MQLPLEITIRDIEHTEAIDTKIRQKAEKLHHLYDRIIYCRVVVEAPQKNKHQGKEFQVNIEVDVPGKVLVVNRHSHRNEDLYVAIRDSFNAMKRQLEDYVDILRGATKSHQLQLTGKIVRLFPDYGFIETSEGNEYYFHETNVLQVPFAELSIGTTVHFLENNAGDSLQAHQVTT
ncbi:MAG: HPF/RaiA family ribosome-associated protein [Gammaproteobacteria bacterium]|nr:HPF/RaiA family ribosome-associated protein [Gammaproteobacteria bacterium]